MSGIDEIKLAFNPQNLLALNIILGVLMFGVALDIRVADFVRIARDPRGPLVGLAAQLLKARSKVRKLKNPYAFPGRLYSHAEFPRAGWDGAIEKAKINNFTFHDCRHSAASELAMNGASLHEIAAVLGHKTLAMVQRYAHLSEQHTMSVVERMNKAVFGE